MKIGIIGGSGLYKLDCLKNTSTVHQYTPFGKTSELLEHAKVGENDIYFLSRHGKGHLIPPHRINYRANIFAMKMLGVTQLIGVSAVGSLDDRIMPGELATPDQFIDKTSKRDSTFFDDLAVHVHFGNPTCCNLRHKVMKAVIDSGSSCQPAGTYVCMEGPQFSSRAESQLNKKDFSYIGMTAMPEGKLAREASMCYANLSLVTDFDAWSESHVTVEEVVATVKSNIEKATAALDLYLKSPYAGHCACNDAIAGACMSDLSQVESDKLDRVRLLLSSHYDL